MRIFIFILFGGFFFSCNQSSKKDPNQAMDDTARMDNPPVTTFTPGNIEPLKITAAEIPATVTYKGRLLEAWKWNDQLGENFLVTSYVAPYAEKVQQTEGELEQSAAIHAVHFAKKGNDYLHIWVMDKTEKACPFDITLEFIPGSVTVTDLDKDGLAETKIQYAFACRSDVSPSTMKLIMYENGLKYSLQGSMWLPYSPELQYTVTEENVNLEGAAKLKDEMDELVRTFGRYETEREFAAAPPEFLVYARREWLKYVKEKLGE